MFSFFSSSFFYFSSPFFLAQRKLSAQTVTPYTVQLHWRQLASSFYTLYLSNLKKTWGVWFRSQHTDLGAKAHKHFLVVLSSLLVKHLQYFFFSCSFQLLLIYTGKLKPLWFCREGDVSSASESGDLIALVTNASDTNTASTRRWEQAITTLCSACKPPHFKLFFFPRFCLWF